MSADGDLNVDHLITRLLEGMFFSVTIDKAFVLLVLLNAAILFVQFYIE